MSSRTVRITLAALALSLVGTAVCVPAAHAGTRSVAACSASDLSAKQTGTAAGMSQIASYITLTNTSGSSCSLNGYPTITKAWTKKGSQQITVDNGYVMNAPQVKPKKIVVAPGGHAWFAIGAGTAFDGPVVTFTRIAFATSPGGSTTTSRVTLPANAPTGKPFPLGVTAYAPGVGNPDAN